MRLVCVFVIVGLTMAAVFQHHLVPRGPKKMETVKGIDYAANVKYRNGLRYSLITARQRVCGFGALEFVGNITVGTPEQQFAVTLDTGSANFWVPGDDCE
uniref:Peptidase A1 domain-containing protein n=1 Tax=Angiostrongylus cantonensis TaxID=6313 RepID=A0A0K0DEY5_ANGCA